jgi:beta-galactosidase/beta-glucuronidase
MSTGFLGTVELIPVNTARIDYLDCDQNHSVEGQCTLTLKAEITSPKGGKTVLKFSCGEKSKKVKVDLKAGKNVVVQTFVIKNPQLWWPAGMGDQHMYDISIDADGQTLTKKVGIRTIEIGENLAFKVNGKGLFVMGANWIPCDVDESKHTYETYLDLLTSAKGANMNMIRLWGGGKFEKDAFYEICDELGLLIWHDFMFKAHKDIPVSDFVNPGVEIPPEPVIIQDETAQLEKEMDRLEAEQKAKEKERLEKEKSKDKDDERKSKREREKERKRREKEREEERERREKEERRREKEKEDEDKPVVSNKPVRRSMKDRIQDILGQKAQ